MNPDPLETCPYDPVHRILRSRMQFHLTRCAKNYPNAKKKQCPFDTRHVINEVEYQYHISHCNSRESVVHYKLQDAEIGSQIRLLPIVNTPAGPADEDWENDTNVKSYNPLQNILERPVVVPVIGLSKAKRKQHRLQERERFYQFQDDTKKQNGQRQENAQMQNDFQKRENPRSTQILDDESGEQEYKPLRRPKNIQLNSSATAMDGNPEKTTSSFKAQSSNIKNTSRSSSAMSSTVIVSDTSRPSSSMSANAMNTSISSYATAVSRNSAKNSSTNLDDEDEKENLDSSILDRTSESVFNKTKESVLNLSKTIEMMQISTDGYRKKSEELDKTLEILQKEKDISVESVNESHIKKFTKCAANFKKLP